MANFYRGGDRSQAFLLPPDVRDWLPEDHLAWLVLDFVAAADTGAFHARRRLGGQGRAGFDPDVLLALLVYCYAVALRSSRGIERACETDVACRVITGNEVPDHTVIARFRQAHDAEIKALFTQLLAMCAQAGMGRVGTICLDGTKMAANASRLANRTREQLQAEVDAILAEAAEVDATEDARLGEARGDELPERLRAGDGRLARFQDALADLDRCYPQGEDAAPVVAARRRVDHARQRLNALWERRRAYEQAKAQGRSRPPGEPVRPAYIRRAEQALQRAERALAAARQRPVTTASRQAPRRNTTDPDSRLMRCQGAWVQGYNAQAAVSADGLIVACGVNNMPADVAAFATMLQRLRDAVAAANITDPVRVIVADAGYHSAANLDLDGPPRLIPPTRHHTADASRQMGRLLDQPAMRRLYQRRQRAEAVFARIKHNQGTRAFSRRGLQAVDAEWHLICLAHNLKALHQQRTQRPRPTG